MCYIFCNMIFISNSHTYVLGIHMYTYIVHIKYLQICMQYVLL